MKAASTRCQFPKSSALADIILTTSRLHQTGPIPGAFFLVALLVLGCERLPTPSVRKRVYGTSGKLPEVAYIVGPEAYTEHSNWPPNFGAWYAANILNILTSNPEVWSKTAVLYMYDENDGFYDHIVLCTPTRRRSRARQRSRRPASGTTDA